MLSIMVCPRGLSKSNFSYFSCGCINFFKYSLPNIVGAPIPHLALCPPKLMQYQKVSTLVYQTVIGYSLLLFHSFSL